MSANALHRVWFTLLSDNGLKNVREERGLVVGEGEEEGFGVGKRREEEMREVERAIIIISGCLDIEKNWGWTESKMKPCCWEDGTFWKVGRREECSVLNFLGYCLLLCPAFPGHTFVTYLL